MSGYACDVLGLPRNEVAFRSLRVRLLLRRSFVDGLAQRVDHFLDVVRRGLERVLDFQRHSFPFPFVNQTAHASARLPVSNQR